MHMNDELTKEQIDKALLDPSAVFASPMEVAEQSGLDPATRIEILRRWEYDAREIQVEEEEAPGPGPDSDLFDRILEALHRLGAHPDLDSTPPTKQGGV
jgi:hypothetical protein